MKLTQRDLAYLAAFHAKMADMPIEDMEPYITTECPECGESPNDMESPHITYNFGNPDSYLVWDDDIVLIGCEGYWVIDPKLLDLTISPNWDDWTKYTK